MEIAAIIFLAIIVIFVVMSLQDNKNRRQLLENNLNNITDFSPSKSVIKIEAITSTLRGVSFDISRKKVAFIITEENFSIKEFKDIISCEIIIDGETVNQTSRTNLLTGAALGGATFGGAGAIVGAIVGGNKTKSKVITRNVSVRFLLNDLDMPSYEIPYIELTYTGSSPPETAKTEAQNLYDFVRVIIHQENNQTS